MADVVPPHIRSRMMASIRGRDTKPELVVRRYLHGCGFCYSLTRKDLPGRPDLVLPRHCAVVFVHGCFWHGHAGCRFATRPASRREFWEAKLSANIERDSRVESELRAEGWRVAIVWECALREDQSGALRKLVRFLRSDREETVIAGKAQGPTNE